MIIYGKYRYGTRIGLLNLNCEVSDDIVERLVQAIEQVDSAPRWVVSAAFIGETGRIELELIEHDDTDQIVLDADGEVKHRTVVV